MTATLTPAPSPGPEPVEAAAPESPTGRRRRTRPNRWWRGPESDPRWARPALFALLAVTAVLYLWNLGSMGWANTYYAAAVQAGTQSWKAFFFGSTDAANFITVDKTPLSLWPMAISARIFGLSSWSILVPQALMGVATVGVLYATVKRWSGAGAGLVAGAVCAAHACRGADVPVQQPRRIADLAHDHRGVLHHPGGRARLDEVDRALGSLHRARVPVEGAPGVPGAARLRARLPDRRTTAARSTAVALRPARAVDDRGRPLVGAHRAAVARVVAALHRRLAEQQLLERALRLQRLRPSHR